MGYILRIGYRHLESIRLQTLVVSMGMNYSKREFDFRSWLEVQAPELVETFDSMPGFEEIPTQIRHERFWHYSLLLTSVLVRYEAGSEDDSIRSRFGHSLVSTSRSDHADEDHAGADKGGAWDADIFPFRAGVVLSLGALEEFERGTVRILTGLKHDGRCFTGKPVPFKPRLSDFEATNPVYEELDSNRRTFTSRGRSEIFESFGITKSTAPWRHRLNASWRTRNQIVHGLSPARVTLSMFLQTHYDVFSAMNWLGNECLVSQNIEL